MRPDQPQLSSGSRYASSHPGFLSEPFVKGLHFTSLLSVGYREELERLLFFNPGQRRVEAGILRAIVRCGPPEIIVRGLHLRVALSKCPDAQNLHALAPGPERPCLAGSVVYLRERPENLMVAHIAVAPQFAMRPAGGGPAVAMLLLAEVFRLARRVKGIDSVELPYGHARPPGHIPVDRGPQAIF